MWMMTLIFTTMKIVYPADGTQIMMAAIETLVYMMTMTYPKKMRIALVRLRLCLPIREQGM